MMLNNTSYATSNSSTLFMLKGLPWEAIFAYQTYLTVSMVLGFLGNLLVIVVYCKNGTVHNTDWFIIFISIFDFISSFLNVPVYLTFTNGMWYSVGNDVICKIHMTFSQSTVIASPILIGGLALERYVKVCRPTAQGLSKDGSRNCCILISVITLLLSVPCIVLYDNDDGTCDTVKEDIIIMINRIYYLVFVIVFIALFVIVIFCYASIAVYIYQSKANLEKYAISNTKNTHLGSEERRILCLHIICCIHKSHISCVPWAPTAETMGNLVLLESSTDKGNFKGKAKSDELVNPNSKQEKGIEIHDKGNTIGDNVITKHENGNKIYDKGYKHDKRNNKRDTRNRIHDNGNKLHGKGNNIHEKGIVMCEKGIKTHHKDSRVNKSLRTTRMTFIICLIFLISWIPPWISFAVNNVAAIETKTGTSFLIFQLFGNKSFLINTFTNPVVYIMMDHTFRDNMRKLFVCKHCHFK